MGFTNVISLYQYNSLAVRRFFPVTVQLSTRIEKKQVDRDGILYYYSLSLWQNKCSHLKKGGLHER